MRLITRPAFWALIVLIHVLLLFVVMPEVRHRIIPLYNEGTYADGYDLLASNLANGSGYRFSPDTARTVMREPGYPILLAGLFLAFGMSFTPVIVTNVVLVLAAAWLVSLLARRLSDGPLAPALATLAFLFHPGMLIAETRGAVEALFVFLLALFLLALHRAVERGDAKDFALAGGTLGLTVLVRSTPLLFPGFLLVYLLVFDRRRSKLVICRNVAMMGIATVCLLSPWIYRNYLVTSRFIPTASVLGVSAHAGHYLCTHLSDDHDWAVVDRRAARERDAIAKQLGYEFKDVEDGYYQLFFSTRDELAFSNYLLNTVIREYAAAPSLFASCVASNVFNIWFRGKTWQSTVTNMLVQTPFLVLAGIGAFLAFGERHRMFAGLLLLFVGYYAAVYIPILAQARYSVPLTPFLALFTAITLDRVVARLVKTPASTPTLHSQTVSPAIGRTPARQGEE